MLIKNDGDLQEREKRKRETQGQRAGDAALRSKPSPPPCAPVGPSPAEHGAVYSHVEHTA